MLKGVARVSFYLLIVVPLIVIGFVTVRQVQYAFDLRKGFDEGSKSGFAPADIQQTLAMSELFTRSYFLIFVCVLMIVCGLLIVARGTGNAISFTKEQKVRYSLKTTFPGLALAVVGCLLLTYSVFKSSQLQLQSTSQLVHLKGLPHQSHAQKGQSGIDPVLPPSFDTVGKQTIAPRNDRGTLAPNGAREEVISEQEVIHKQSSADISKPVSKEDLAWAKSLALRSVTNDYAPTREDRLRYDRIRNHSLKRNTLLDDSGLDWAFMLLVRTQAGYQPSSKELDQFGEVVRNLVDIKGQSAGMKGDRVSR